MPSKVVLSWHALFLGALDRVIIFAEECRIMHLSLGLIYTVNMCLTTMFVLSFHGRRDDKPNRHGLQSGFLINCT